jgi:hypothetical protein
MSTAGIPYKPAIAITPNDFSLQFRTRHFKFLIFFKNMFAARFIANFAHISRVGRSLQAETLPPSTISRLHWINRQRGAEIETAQVV